MTIEEQFNLIAKQYDVNRRKFIPCFGDFYETATKLIASSIDEPRRVLDLGAGTGLLTSFWYKEFGSAEYVLTDIAEDMLDVSRKRFAGLENVRCCVSDFTKELPEGDFDAIISALAIHHLDDGGKAELFGKIYDKLPKGGIFVNYDQFCAGTEPFNARFDAFWERQLRESDLTAEDIRLWKERRKLDRECSPEEEAEMLKKCSFSYVKCVYSYNKFSVIAAIK